MTWKEIQHEINTGNKVFRSEWEDCKYVRRAVDSDIDFINYPVEGVTVEDCNRRQCDCKIVIYQPTKEDTIAKDWFVLKVYATAEN